MILDKKGCICTPFLLYPFQPFYLCCLRKGSVFHIIAKEGVNLF